MRRAGGGVLAVCLLAGACGGGEKSVLQSGERRPTGMIVTSTAFKAKAAVPERYSCEGENIPPPLRWEGTPPGTVELAHLVLDRVSDLDPAAAARSVHAGA